MKYPYNVRFTTPQILLAAVPADDLKEGLPRLSKKKTSARQKSHLGCQECKARRVKCDETFPVCLRCQRRGFICRATPRQAKWTQEMPWLDRTYNNPLGLVPNADKKLLQFWVEKFSHTMVLDPETNPFSFQILQYFNMSPSLVHAVQSITAAQQQYFEIGCFDVCQKERLRAFALIRDELKGDPARLPSTFLSVFFLGISATWVEHNPNSFGKEHLIGGRAIVDAILADKELRKKNPLTDLVIGTYVYWDMACALHVEPGRLPPLNEQPIYEYIQQNLRSSYHPVGGYWVQLIYLIGCLSRYCRQILDGHERDWILEATFEEQLISWQTSASDEHLVMLGNTYRDHGLITLYRVCGHTTLNLDLENEDATVAEPGATDDEIIHRLAVSTIRRLLGTPIDIPHVNLHAVPLFTAATELSHQDAKLRLEAISRFKALYSMNHFPVNLWVMDFLEELWRLRDSGMEISWFQLNRMRQWNLNFA